MEHRFGGFRTRALGARILIFCRHSQGFRSASDEAKKGQKPGVEVDSDPGWLFGIHAWNAALAVKMADALAELARATGRDRLKGAGPANARQRLRKAWRASKDWPRGHVHRGLGAQRVALHVLDALGEHAHHGGGLRQLDPRRERSLLSAEREQRHQEREGPQPKGRAAPLVQGAAEWGLGAHPPYEAYPLHRRKLAPARPR